MIRIVKKMECLLPGGQKKKVLGLLVLMVIGAFFEVIGVSLMVPLMSALVDKDIITNNTAISAFCNWFHISTHQQFAFICVVMLIIVYIVKDVYLVWEYNIQYKFIYNNRFKTQSRLLNSYLNRPYEYFLGVNSGEIIRIINTDVQQSYNLLSMLMGMVTEMVVSVALIMTVFIISPVITIVVAVVLSITMFAIAKCIKPSLRKAGLSRKKHMALTNKWLLQSINGIKEIKVSDTKEFFQKNYDISGRKTVEADRKNAVWANIPKMLIEMTSVCSVLIIIAVLILNGNEINELIPALSAFAMAAIKLLPSANKITVAINNVAYLEPALDQLLENLESEDYENDAANHKKKSDDKKLDVKTSIDLHNITFCYPDNDKKIFDNADMKIPVGKSIGIVGTSGAGKTTAVDIMLGLLAPQEGQVLVDDVDIRVDKHAWLKHIGYIPQMIFMLDDTIRANVAFGYGESDISDEEVWRALEEAQLSEFVKKLPDTIYTQIGERGIRLSGGQRQRIGIARALYPDPEVLVFDEATSALDNETEASIMESIDLLHGKKTLVIIAHRLSTIKNCDIVYRVNKGKIFVDDSL